jgi:hypothetical protein
MARGPPARWLRIAAPTHRIFGILGQAKGGAVPDLGQWQDDNAGEGRTAHARDEVMTSDEATDSWLRFLLRVGPRVDGVVLRVIAERLANATDAA